MRLLDQGTALRIAGYPFRPSAARRGPIEARRIAEILPCRFPPELWLDDGEIVFVSRTDLAALVAFADRNGIPLTDREDLWSLLLEDCLDTEFSAEVREQTRRQIRALGIDESEEAAWKAWSQPRVLQWNTIHWEWVHLGLYDLLSAFYGPLARMGLGRFRRVSAEAMAIASRAPRHDWDEEGFRRDLGMAFEPALHGAWEALWSTIGIAASPELYRSIVDAYGTLGRYYHDRGHLQAVVERLVADGASIEAQLAGWFHDFVDPSSKGAEEASARAAETKLVAVGFAPDRARRVAELIGTTANHWTKVGNDKDARDLARADLAILGAESSKYRLYAVQVRLEYRRVPWIFFRHGRLKFLKALAARERLGFDDDPEWERRARENVAWEIGEWRRFRTPKPW